MLRYILKRLILIMPTLFGVAVFTFILSNILPGDPALARLGPGIIDEGALQSLRVAMGLDKPLYIQFAYYLKGLVHLDLGFSWNTGRPVLQDLIYRFPATFELVSLSLAIAITIGIPLGVISATRHGGISDHFSRTFAIFGVSTPIFWLGLGSIYLFFVQLQWLPLPLGRLDSFLEPPKRISGLYIVDSLLTGNWATLKSAVLHLILPVGTLSYTCIATILRLTRSSMLETLRQNYIRTARTKGVSLFRIHWVHALKNSLTATTTGIALTFGQLLGGAVVTETVFSFPGMGTYAVTAIRNLDYSAIQAFVLVNALIFLIINLITDLIYAYLDPAIRYG